jgi:hypothetical protein
MEEVFAVERWFGQLMQMAQADPTVMDVIDFRTVGRMLAKRLGVPSDVMKSEEEIQQMQIQREQAAQAQQAMQAQQMALEQAGASAQVADVVGEVGPENAEAVAQGLRSV